MYMGRIPNDFPLFLYLVCFWNAGMGEGKGSGAVSNQKNYKGHFRNVGILAGKQGKADHRRDGQGMCGCPLTIPGMVSHPQWPSKNAADAAISPVGYRLMYAIVESL
ncbi:hypothetical protein SUGI_0193110 [Cryptomeria japonica]|nr:hypothetical protein SUGI_0193110 [Cryptomeria japonica]